MDFGGTKGSAAGMKLRLRVSRVNDYITREKIRSIWAGYCVTGPRVKLLDKCRRAKGMDVTEVSDKDSFLSNLKSFTNSPRRPPAAEADRAGVTITISDSSVGYVQ